MAASALLPAVVAAELISVLGTIVSTGIAKRMSAHCQGTPSPRYLRPHLSLCSFC